MSATLSLTRSVLIIGSGFSGTMTAVQLARKARGPLNITLLERSGQFAQGLAYGTTDDDHLLNVPASRISALPDDPGHFLAYARREQPELTGDEFMPRTLFARYIKHLLAQAQEAHPQVKIDFQEDNAIALDPAPHGFNVRGASGKVFAANTVVLALGNTPSAFISEKFPHILKRSERLISPWDGQRLRHLPTAARVLLIGSGLTMIDAAMSLEAGGHKGQILAVSRKGQLPEPHISLRFMPQDPTAQQEVEKLAAELCRGDGELSSILHCLRQAFSDEGPGRILGWRGVFDLLRPWTASLWQALNYKQQRRFMRHARRYWDNHRHRMPPESAARLETMQQEGRFKLIAGRILSINEESDHFALRLRERGQHSEQTYAIDYLVDCAGIDRNINQNPEPILRHLLSSGLALADEHELGLKTHSDGRLMGSASAPLYTLGPWRRGQLWESIAVPELRVQAAKIAEAILAKFDEDQGLKKQ